jgi:hypothetical protein
MKKKFSRNSIVQRRNSSKFKFQDEPKAKQRDNEHLETSIERTESKEQRKID